jgi:hypothetical protein
MDETTSDAMDQEDVQSFRQHLDNLPDTSDHNDLRSRLDKALILFDDDHPEIAAAIRSVLNVLTQSGV